MSFDSALIHFPRPLRWLFIDLNSYFASVEQQLDARLRNRPIIVSPIDTDTTCAIAASYEAKAYGIRTGTPVWEAKRKCRDLIVVSAQHGRYVEFHHAIMEEIWRHIPVTKVCSIDEAACWLADNENSAEGAYALGMRIKAGIRRNVGDCLRSSIGIAPNRLLAKIASNMQKPDGLTILRADDLPQRLFPLKLRDITGVGARMEKRLMRKGVYDIAGICSRSPQDMGRIWGGMNGDQLWYLLHGFDLPEKATTRRSIGHSSVLAPENRGLESARLASRRLAVKASSRLRREGYYTQQVILHARFVDYSKWGHALRLVATQDSFRIVEALEGLWPALARASARFPSNNCIKMLGVTLAEIVPVDAAQYSLFDLPAVQAPPKRSLKLSQAMDHINQRFGRNAVMLGPKLAGRPDQVGTKIAFTRIPDAAEFRE